MILLLPFNNTTTTNNRIAAPTLLYMVSKEQESSKKQQQQHHHAIDEGSTIMMMKTTVTTNTSNKNKNNKLQKPKSKKSVRFQCIVDVREYPIILGDNPSCNCLLLKTGGGGPPLSIDWIYESKTQPITSQRNSNNGQDISKEGKPRKRCGAERYDLLLNQGYTLLEIKRAMKSIKIDQRRRNYTTQKFLAKELMNQHLSQINDSIRRNLKLKLQHSSLSLSLTTRQHPSSSKQQQRHRNHHQHRVLLLLQRCRHH